MGNAVSLSRDAKFEPARIMSVSRAQATGESSPEGGLARPRELAILEAVARNERHPKGVASLHDLEIQLSSVLQLYMRAGTV